MCYQLFLGFLRAIHEQGVSRGALGRASPQLCGNFEHNVAAQYRVDELNEPSLRCPGIRSLLPLPGGDPLTGGTDLKIRRWDHCESKRQPLVTRPTGKVVLVVAATHSGGCNRDSILSLHRQGRSKSESENSSSPITNLPLLSSSAMCT
ncbi:hypothetical protein Tco_0809023 [Tanacetum coccineum]